MLWIGICVHPYTVIPVQVGGGYWGFWISGVDLSLCDTLYCHCWGSNPSWSTICFHMICVENDLASWYMLCMEYAATLTVIRLCRLGVDFGVLVLGVDLSLSDVVMSLSRPQQASDWIPDPYWMYSSALWLCCAWAHGATHTVICLCRLGVDFGVF